MSFVLPVHTFAQASSRPVLLVGGLFFGMMLGLSVGLSHVQSAERAHVQSAERAESGMVDVALPTSTSNAALHYQRALLFLAEVDRQHNLLAEVDVKLRDALALYDSAMMAAGKLIAQHRQAPPTSVLICKSNST